MTDKKYQICSRCVMDTSAMDISFNDQGECSFCEELLVRSSHILNAQGTHRQQNLETFIAKVKKEGMGKQYDCIIGISGGVDSSWVLVKAVEMGLRPLAVHMDNGWNSELAQNNIANLVQSLNIDLYTHVIDWHEYRKLMQAFFDSDVVDIELLYDNAMLAVNYHQSAKFGIKTILAGTNQATEGMKMPKGWNQLKFDKRNIVAIAKKFGNIKLKTFPSVSVMSLVWYEFIKRNKWISFLDMLDFNKAAALEILQRDYGYKPYPYKHYESIFTRFYQGYLLPEKFNIDKRKVHFSTLIISGQMSRNEALQGLEGIPYASEKDLEQDKNYFLKKMGWTQFDLDQYLARPGKPHSTYPSEKDRYDFLLKVYRLFLNK
ncbi:MAG: N-acetyl sugar amidotransferase [Methylococcaceae bacterium]|nr:N-acetyl sugar amidotransferase [Methylococcaceae bacterium]